jgi:6-phosphofructokinase 2
MSRIVTLTLNPALDLATEVERVEPGPKLRCGPVRRESGGGGLNVSRAITSLGGTTLALHASGGATGALVEEHLVREGVAQRRLPIAGITRENLAVRERVSGELLRFVMPGPVLSESEWSGALDACVEAAEGGYLVASGSLPPGAPDDVYVRLARALAPRGVRLLLDTSGAALRAAMGGGVHLVKMNYRELDELAGHEQSDREREEGARRVVASGGAAVVVVTLGPAGVLVVDGDGAVSISAPRVSSPDSAVGAGDSFMGGLALSLDRGLPLVEACTVGVASAAAAMLTPGTEPCRRPQVERMLEAMGAGAGLLA